MERPADWLPDLPDSARAQSISTGWKSRLLIGKRGSALSVVANAITALRYAPEWNGVLRFNESSLMTVATANPPFGAARIPFEWSDEHDVLAAAWLQGQAICVSKELAGQAVQVVARERTFHPVRDYLGSLKWDGIGRIDDWLTIYVGVEACDYVRAVAAKFLIACVGRILKPGCKADNCLILEGPQGTLKSTALRILAGSDFFTDDIADLGSKDSVMQTRGMWIIELSELDAMSRADIARVKAFMSRQVDRIRPPYGRRVLEMPRECVLVGTSNKDTYFKDETGNRRFWPVKCGLIKVNELRRDRDQLWAEARHRFDSGETWWLDREDLVQAAATETQGRYESDPWDEIIARWLQNPKACMHNAVAVAEFHSSSESITIQDILIHCIGKGPHEWTQADQNRIARVLTAMKWKRVQRRLEGKREWRYVRSVTSVTS